MPFSKQLESQYRALTQDQFKAVSFNAPEDFDSLIKEMNQVVAGIEKDEKLLKDNKDPVAKNKYGKLTTDIKTFIDECFDLYATDNIVDKTNNIQEGMTSNSPWKRIPAFTSKNSNISKAEKIKEAKAELKSVIIDEIKKILNKFSTMSKEARLSFIADKKKENQIATNNQKKMKDAKAPAEGSAAHTLNDEQWRIQQLQNLIPAQPQRPGLWDRFRMFINGNDRAEAEEAIMLASFMPDHRNLQPGGGNGGGGGE